MEFVKTSMISRVQVNKRAIVCLLVALLCLTTLAAAGAFISVCTPGNDSWKSLPSQISMKNQFNSAGIVRNHLSERFNFSDSLPHRFNLTPTIPKANEADIGRIRMVVQSSGNLSPMGENMSRRSINVYSTNKDVIYDTTGKDAVNYMLDDNKSNKNIIYKNTNNGSLADDSTAKNTTSKNVPENITNITKNISDNAEISVYVYNDDNDRMDISLFIDSLPKGKAEADKGTQEKFGNYSLRVGFHRFKIAWKDPDTNKVYESELNKEISGDDAVILYTVEHTAPDKFDLLVSVKNDNDKETKAYLHIDGKYENTQLLSADSTTEFDKVSLEEGVHDVSIRWLDPYTNSEYEKKKRVTVDNDEAVIFIASKGVSFKDKGEAPTVSEINAPYDAPNYEHSANSGIDNVNAENNANKTDNIINLDNSSSKIDNSTDKVDNGTDKVNNSTNTIDKRTNESENLINDTTVNKANDKGIEETSNPYYLNTLRVENKSGENETNSSQAGLSALPLIYPVVLLIAVYLVFRR
jgi:hypothetical protein